MISLSDTANQFPRPAPAIVFGWSERDQNKRAWRSKEGQWDQHNNVKCSMAFNNSIYLCKKSFLVKLCTLIQVLKKYPESCVLCTIKYILYYFTTQRFSFILPTTEFKLNQSFHSISPMVDKKLKRLHQISQI